MKLRELVLSVRRVDVSPRLWMAGLVLGILGLVLRFVLAWFSIGSDDAHGWRHHATLVSTHGVRLAYENPSPSVWKFNHPPLMGYWAVLAARMSASDFHTFSLWMKIPGLLAELGSAFLIYRIVARRHRTSGAWAFAAYAFSLPAILVSGFHCNTDTAYAYLTLLAMYWMQETRRPFWSGVALAAALNVKLLPIFLIPPLLAQCRSLRELLRLSAGLALGIVPYLPFLVTSSHAMYVNMVSYNSLRLDWGIVSFLQHAQRTPRFAEYANTLLGFFVAKGRYVILVAVVGFSVLAAVRRRPSGYELGALAWALFLVLTPGYGIQYAVCVLPLLFVADLNRAMLYSLNAGLMLLFIYTTKMELTLPLQGFVQYPFPPISVPFGVLAWATLVTFAFAIARKILAATPADTKSTPELA